MMRRFRSRALVAAFVALGLWAAGMPAAQAATVYGLRGAGVLTNPPGEMPVTPGQFTFGVSAFRGQSFTYLRYGLSRDVELGATAALSPRDGVGPLVAVRWQAPQRQRPALVVGMQYREGYVVAAKLLGDGWARGYAGLRMNFWGDEAMVLRPFAGVQRVLNPVVVRRPGQLAMPVVTAGVEFDGMYLSAAMTFQFGRDLQVDLGVQSSDKLRLGGGLSVSRAW